LPEIESPTMTFTAVIAEDEPILRAELSAALAETWPDLRVVGEAEDGATALEMIAAHTPDFALLDIRMPGLSGLDVAAALASTSPKTAVVFVTAYDEYAIDAFRQGAVDYLLKPLERARLAETVARLKSRVRSGPTDTAAIEAAAKLLSTFTTDRQQKAAPLTWVSASAGRETRLIMVEDIAFFQADNKYTVVMTAEGEALIRKPIKELLDELDPAHWKQVHRSTVVNLRAVKSITRDDTGKGVIHFRAVKETVSVSQPFMHLFRNM
jgi:DNA-binding LytR/AlgR family response regulator